MGCGASAEVKASKPSKQPLSASIIPIRQFQGILTVKIHGCRNLPPMDKATGKADPFVILSFGDQTFKTGTVMRSLEPSYNQVCRLFINKEQTDNRMRISVYDKDYGSKNDFMGNMELSVGKYINDSKPSMEAEWHKLLPKSARRLASSNDNGGDSMTGDMGSESGTLASALVDETARSTKSALGEIQISISYTDSKLVEKEFWMSWFTAMDADNDDCLSEPEFKEFVQHVGGKEIPEGKLRELFHSADVNQDNKVTTQELTDFMSRKENEDLVDDTTVYHFALERGRMGDEEKEMKDGFVTESEAAKGWVFRMSEWVGGEQYDIGVNTGAKAKRILVKERHTGVLKEEVISPNINLAMRAMYQSTMGSKMVSLDHTHKLLKKVSVDQGKKYDDPRSIKYIPKFIERFHLNVAEVADPLDSFKTYNEFFYRKLKASSRPIDNLDDPKKAVSPADCRIMVFNDVETSKKLWIKGREFSMANMLGPANEACFEGGGVVVCRLAPQDYHRYHVPCSGTLGPLVPIDGTYFTVNPVAVNCMDVFTENKRTVTVIHSEEFGKVAYVNVGATLVGSIVMTKHEGESVVKGDELGYFAFGGSTVVLCFEKGRITFDADLLENSLKSLETQVYMGNSLGIAS